MPKKEVPDLSDSQENKKDDQTLDDDNVFTRKTIPTIAPPKDRSFDKYNEEGKSSTREFIPEEKEEKSSKTPSHPPKVTIKDGNKDQNPELLQERALAADLEKKLNASREELKIKTNIFNADFSPEDHHSSNRHGQSKLIASNTIKGIQDKVSTLTAESNDASNKLRLRPPPSSAQSK